MFFGIYFHDFERCSSWSINIEQIIECIAGEGMLPDCLSLCLCAFEAQNDLVTRGVARFLVNHQTPLSSADTIIKFGHPRTPYDYSAMVYVLSNIRLDEGTWKSHEEVVRKNRQENCQED